jgi:hypothetical protein
MRVQDRETGIVFLGKMAPTDSDGYWLVDATANMVARNTHITAVGMPTWQRLDGQPLTSGDIVVNNVAVPMGGMGWTFRATGNGAIGGYLVAFPLTLANGDTITRTGELWSVANL